MSLKLKQAIKLIVILFLSGNLISYIGLSKGRDMASALSRPAGASMWSISDEMISACTYLPVIMGVSLVILSIAFSTVLFVNWIKENK